MTICRDYFLPGRRVEVDLPSDEHYSTLTPVGQHLLKNIHQAARWPLIVYQDTDNYEKQAVITDDECIGHVVFVSCSRTIDEMEANIVKTAVRLNFRHIRMTSWRRKSQFVIAVENDCKTINFRTLAQKILSIFWFHRIVNVVVVVQDEGSTENLLNVSNSVSFGRSRHLALSLYTWFPYQSPNRCTQVEDVVLLDKWVMKGKGFLVQNSNLFPQKIGKTFNGCPLRGMTRIYKNLVNCQLPPGCHSNSSTPALDDGWEVRLFGLIAKSLNMSETYIPAPNSFQNGQYDGVLSSFEYDKADVLFGGAETRGRWAWQDHVEVTCSYFTHKIRWYVPCSFKYPRWSSIFRIFYPHLWVCVLLSLAVTSVVTFLVARCGSTYTKSPEYWTMTNSLTCAWAVILGIGAPALPHKASVRAIFLTWLLFSLAINTVFQTYLTTFLTESGYESPIENTDEMLASKIKYGYHPVFDTVYKGSNDVNSLKILRNRILCLESQKCVEWAYIYKNISMILGDINVEELYSTSALLDENSKPLICPLDDGIVASVTNAMIMRLGDPLLERVNEIIHRVVEAGLLMQWKKSHFDNIKTRSSRRGAYSLFDSYYHFTLQHMHPAFYLLLAGFAVSALVLLFELAHHRSIHARSSVFSKERGK
jgi:hypothetical protein